MPYEMLKNGHKWEVVNKETGETKGESESKEKALAHMQALYANEPKGYCGGGEVKGYAEGGIVADQPDDKMGAINNYFQNFKNQMDQTGVDKQKAVNDYFQQKNNSFGNSVAKGAAGFADALMQGVARAGNPGFLKNIEDEQFRNMENQQNFGKSMNEQNLAGIQAKQSMDEMNTGNPLGQSEARAYRPLLEKLFPGKTEEAYAGIESNPQALKSIFGPSANLATQQMRSHLMSSWADATPQERELAKSLVEGNVRVTDMGLRDRGRIVSLANEYAQMNGLPFQSFGGDVKAGMAKNLAYGKMGSNALSLNTALGHAADAMKSFEAIKNSDVSMLNVPINKLRAKTNDPNIIALQLNLNALRGELANVFKGSGATDQEIGHWEKALNENLTPAQFMAAGQKIQELLLSRLNAMEFQQHDVMGGATSERKLLSPKGEKIMGDLEGHHKQQTTTHPQDEAAIQWAKSNPNDSRAKRILALHGM